jgi:hypothetical protein
MTASDARRAYIVSKNTVKAIEKRETARAKENAKRDPEAAKALESQKKAADKAASKAKSE